MSYRVTEIFLTLQGEGYWSGRAAVFCRFSGCNLWNGEETGRSTAACRFCDTDFLVHAPYANANELADEIEKTWRGPAALRMVVLTGGEPTLQVDHELLVTLHLRGFYVALETNGTRRLPPPIGTRAATYDWVCVSPKASTVLRVDWADELKVVWPQPGLDLEALTRFSATHRWLSPMDVRHLDIPDADALTQSNTAAAVRYCLDHPHWRLNTQTHKEIGIR